MDLLSLVVTLSSYTIVTFKMPTSFYLCYCKVIINNYINHKMDIVYRGVNPIPKFIEYN